MPSSWAYKNVTGEEQANGCEIELELPFFDFGSTRMARAEATYMQAVHRTAEVAINARDEASSRRRTLSPWGRRLSAVSVPPRCPKRSPRPLRPCSRRWFRIPASRTTLLRR